MLLIGVCFVLYFLKRSNGNGFCINLIVSKLFNEKKLCILFVYKVWCIKVLGGVCDDFERETNVKDCGIISPKGYLDQWAIKVTGTTGQSNEECPESVIEGKPPSNYKCVSSYDDLNTKKAWRPCRGTYFNNSIIEIYKIEAAFNQMVIGEELILHLASDGNGFLQTSKIKVEVKDTNENYHDVLYNKISITCSKNPMVISLKQNTNKLPFLTKSVRISFDIDTAYIAITAIGLRSQEGKTMKPSCTKNQLYMKKLRKCRDKKQKYRHCKRIEIKHGISNCSGFNDGDYCKVKCKKGYRPIEEFEVICDNGKWDKKQNCRPVRCPKPQIKYALITGCHERTFGKICSFKCNSDARLSGNNTKIICKHDGRWSAQKAFCYISCKLPVNIDNGVSKIEDRNTNNCHARHGEDVPIGTSCRYQCKQGYQPIRSTKHNLIIAKTLNVYCNENATWIADGTCEKLRCQTLSNQNRYLYSCTDENYFGSVCSTNCLNTQSNIHQVVCEANGQWSSPFDVCKNKGVCPSLPSHPYIDFATCKTDSVNRECKPTCYSKNGEIPDLVIKTEEDISDVAIYCMPNKMWMPSITNLVCMKPCIKDLIGDDFCDCENNNKRCRYDGGDCCPTEGRKEVSFLFNKCKCEDPKFKNLVRDNIREDDGSADR